MNILEMFGFGKKTETTPAATPTESQPVNPTPAAGALPFGMTPDQDPNGVMGAMMNKSIAETQAPVASPTPESIPTPVAAPAAPEQKAA